MKKMCPFRTMNSKLKLAAAGFGGAFSIILFGIFSFGIAPSVTNFIWTVGLALVALSNKVCAPNAVACIFGADSQGRSHLWFFICLFVGWWALVSFVSWFVVKHVVSKNAAV